MKTFYQASIHQCGIQDILLEQYRLHELPYRSDLTKQKLTQSAPSIYTLQDIYKCLHQASFGIGHSIDDPDQFKDILIREMTKADLCTNEPLFEIISPDHSQMRLNLRPYKQLFQQDEPKAVSLLLDVCLDSAKHLNRDANHFLRTLTAFKELNNRGEIIVEGVMLMFPPQAVQYFLSQILDLINQMEMIPVFSHSAVYRQMNQPSYRVVDTSVLNQSPLAFILDQFQAEARVKNNDDHS